MTAWYRLPELSAALREAFPASPETAYVLVTTLGGATFLTFGLAVLYWAGVRRRATARVVGYGFLALAIVVALKSWIGAPRPPDAVALIAEDGYGFPSGHATAAVVVYGGLAVEFDRLDDPRVLLPAAFLIAAVALSRVLLGVHYLGDVLAGFLLGVAVLLVARRLAGDPSRVFALATAAAVVAVLVTDGGETALGGIGGALGGLLVTSRLDRLPRVRSRIESIVFVVAGVGFVAAVEVAEGLATGLPGLSALSQFVLVVGVLGLPVAADRFDIAGRIPT